MLDEITNMPTLVKVPKSHSENGNASFPNGETANDSEFVWLSKQLGDKGNESTWSCTHLENAIAEIGHNKSKEISQLVNPKKLTHHDKQGLWNKHPCSNATSLVHEVQMGWDVFSKQEQNIKPVCEVESTCLQESNGVQKCTRQKISKQRCEPEKNEFKDERNKTIEAENNEYHSLQESELISSNTLSEKELESHLKHQDNISLTQNNCITEQQPNNQVSCTSRQHLPGIRESYKGSGTELNFMKCFSNDHKSSQVITRECRIGSHEDKYVTKYKTFVDASIMQYLQKHPGKLPDYQGMCLLQKQKEHQRVMDLLQRLGITSNKENIGNYGATNVSFDIRAEQSESRLCTETDFHSSCSGTPFFKVRSEEKIVSPAKKSALHTSDTANVNASIALLSPNCLLSPSNHISTIPQETVAASHPVNKQDDDDVSLTVKSPHSENDVFKSFNVANESVVSSCSVAETRKNCRYESPERARHHKKRLASTSGKRGSDASRARLTSSSVESINSMTPKINVSSPPNHLEDSIGRLSIADLNLFPASQSPIVRYSLNSLSMHSARRLPSGLKISDISLDDNYSDCSKASYHHCSIEETLMMEDRRVCWDFDGKRNKEAPTHVCLKTGKTFHLNPLKMEHHRNYCSEKFSFPDPLSFYPDRIQRRLRQLCHWLLRRDHKATREENYGKAVILSLSGQQLIDLILRTLLKTSTPGDNLSQSSNAASVETLHGNTLIVTRTKEELDSWGRSFREGSAFTVLNHSTMHLKERKSQSGAGKCTKFDIVLTTFDALKAPDVTVTLDSDGHVINHKVGVDNGWYSSKNSSQCQEVDDYKQLSVLHRVSWRRVIYVDVIGRKSFLAKCGTSRAAAAIAINAASRFAFFLQSGKENGLQSLLESDRNVIQSLASILRIKGGEDKQDTLLDSMIVDFKDHTKRKSENT